MSKKLESLRRSLAITSDAARRPGLALGVQLRNEAAWSDKKVPGLPLDGEESDEESAGVKVCKKCDHDNPPSAKYCAECDKSLGEDTDARSAAINTRSRLIVQQAEAVDALNRQVRRLESSRSHTFDMPDLSIFSAKELKALHLGPKGSGLVDVGGGRKELGLISPQQAQAVLDGLEGTNKASRRAR